MSYILVRVLINMSVHSINGMNVDVTVRCTVFEYRYFPSLYMR